MIKVLLAKVWLPHQTPKVGLSWRGGCFAAQLATEKKRAAYKEIYWLQEQAAR